MSHRIQCDTCKALFAGWHERISVEATGEGPTMTSGRRFLPVAGDYCSIGCLAHKMQAAHPGARDEMLEALSMTEPA